MDGLPAVPLQRRLRQQPVPRPAAVLQMTRRRRRARQPHDRSPAPAAAPAIRPHLHRSGIRRPREGLRRTVLRTAIIAVFTATGIRLSELAGIRYSADDPHGSDIDLWQREITVHGKGGKDRIVKFGHHAAVSVDRYLRARARHPLAARPQLWLGAGNREPLSADGIYQMIARRGQQAGVAVHRNGSATTSPTPGSTAADPRGTSWNCAAGPPRRCCAATGQRPRPPHLRPHHDRHLTLYTWGPARRNMSVPAGRIVPASHRRVKRKPRPTHPYY